jgi:hypothetical protein
MTILGMVMFDGCVAGSRANRIEDCDISVGGDGWSGTNQGGVIWMDDAAHVEVANCKIHDNDTGSESYVNANNGLFMIYECNGGLIENCEIYSSAGTGMTLKDDVQNVVIRNNWIHDNAASGIWTGNNTASAYALSCDIYQNVIANNNGSNSADPDEHGGIGLRIYTSLCKIYNNTFHRNYYADIAQSATAESVPFEAWNNLHYGARAYYLNWPYSGSLFDADYLDYNLYNSGTSGWRYRTNTYASLAAWQTAADALLTGAEANSISSDPNLLNTSGTWSAAADYKRSSYPSDGRGGSYSSVIGAYITGSETIGTDW